MRLCNGLILACFAILGAGCDSVPIPPATPPTSNATQLGNVVVLDLSAVAKALGEDALFKEQIEKANTTLTQQLSQIAGQLNKQIETEKTKLGENLDDAARQHLARLTAQAQVELRKKQQEARRKGQQFQTGLRQQFLDKIRPAAVKVANERKASAITFVGNTLLWHNPRIDITEAVIAELQSSGAATTAESQTQKTN